MRFKPTILKIILSLVLSLIVVFIIFLNTYDQNTTHGCYSSGGFLWKTSGVPSSTPCSYLEFYGSTLIWDGVIAFILVYIAFSLFEKKIRKKKS